MVTLTEEQNKILSFYRDDQDSEPGNLMISARAGSSKSFTLKLIARLRRFVSQPVLMTAFNKKIADEIKGELPSNFDVKTLNALGHGAWIKAIPGKKIEIDTGKMYKIVKRAVVEFSLKEDELMQWVNLADKAKNAGYVPPEAPFVHKRRPDYYANYGHSFWEDLTFEVDLKYDDKTQIIINSILLESIKQAYQGHIDFNDQIYMSVNFNGIFRKYPVIFIDEAQDLSPANHIMIENSLEKDGKLIVVGDPYQSIYGFRGAASNSMEMFKAKFDFTELFLTYSFRCPSAVAKRQQSYVKDFKAFPANGEGVIETWNDWSVDDIPWNGAVVCRNNAPLFRLALKLIMAKRVVTILGRDIGTSLTSLLGKLCKKQNVPVEELKNLITSWRFNELAKVPESEAKQAGINDRADCLMFICSGETVHDFDGACRFINELFADKTNAIILGSGHKVKGLEWNWVMHLDAWRLPARQAKTEEALKQEYNLQYVIETRTKDTLVMADLRNCVEAIGDDD